MSTKWEIAKFKLLLICLLLRKVEQSLLKKIGILFQYQQRIFNFFCASSLYSEKSLINVQELYLYCLLYKVFDHLLAGP